jgi:SAM-dependent methyltransferase
MFISAVAGALTIAVTAQLTLDLGAVPLLWVLPLVTLLLSFVVAFGNLRSQRSLAAAAPVALTIMCFMFFNTGDVPPVELVVLWCGLLFLVQCGLQSRVRTLAPTGGARGSFYVALAVGGFAGSLIVGCLVPYYFDTASLLAATPLTAPVLQPILGSDPIAELGWCMVAAAFALVGPERWRPRELILAGVVGAIAVFLVVNDASALTTAVVSGTVTLLGALAITYLPAIAGRPSLFAVTVTLIILAISFVPKGREMFRTRNVYGVLMARESVDGTFTQLFHGTTIHGMQTSERIGGTIRPVEPQNPLTYFHRGSPVGHVFKSLAMNACPRRVGVIGLGAGTLAAYARAGDDFEFYEIDPGVIEAAEGPHFSYIAAARQRGARVSIIEGDGRQTLARRAGPKLDLAVVDAFSSGSIPAHLLTMEAFEIIERQLAPGGYIVFHVSNRYFAVEQVVAANANRLGWAHALKHGDGADLGTSASDWVVLRPHQAPAADACAVDLLDGSAPAATASAFWTDDFSTPLAVVKSRGLWRRLKGERRGPAKPVFSEGQAPAPADRPQSPGQ